MRILVTGVSGFVGPPLARHLVSRGHEVFGTYIREKPDLADLDLTEIDLLDAERLREAISRIDPEAVVHLAGLSHVGESWSRPADYFRVNVLGTENLLRAAPDVRMLAASSAEIYGSVPAEEQPIEEARQPAPQSPYALTKAAMERLVLASGGIVVRCFNIVGPGQARTFALPTFAAQLSAIRAALQPPVLRVGNLTARRDFVHVADAVEAYEILLSDAVPGQTYNLGSGRALSVEEALRHLIEVSGVSPKVEVDPERFRPVDLPLLQADNSRLRKLGWELRRGLDDALQDLWQAILEDDQRMSEAPEPSTSSHA